MKRQRLTPLQQVEVAGDIGETYSSFKDKCSNNLAK
jgi:hypothetical protein